MLSALRYILDVTQRHGRWRATHGEPVRNHSIRVGSVSRGKPIYWESTPTGDYGGLFSFTNNGASGRENRRKNCHIFSEALTTLVGAPSSHSGNFGPGPGHTCPAPVSFHNTISVPWRHGL